MLADAHLAHEISRILREVYDGDGARRDAVSLGIREPYLRSLKAFSGTMSALTKSYGFGTPISIPTVVCSICESHRRGIFDRDGFHRRPEDINVNGMYRMHGSCT